MTNDVTDNPLTEHNAAAETPMNVQTEQNKKRKGEGETESNKKPKVQENRAIYITGLPDDTNEDEIADVFRKYGVIDMGTDGKPRVKMYTDENGNFNGDALVVYFKKESIKLAIQMMDDYYFRIEDQKHGTISVKEADMSYKRHKDTDKIVSKATRKDRKAAERNRNMLNQKLAEWSDDEEEIAEKFATKKSKWAKVVIIKHAFSLKELEEEEEAYLEIKQDMRDVAEKYGTVTNLTLFDLEKDGIVTVRFKEFEEAEQFVEAYNGKRYSERALELSIAEDKPKFKKSSRHEGIELEGEGDDSDKE